MITPFSSPTRYHQRGTVLQPGVFLLAVLAQRILPGDFTTVVHWTQSEEGFERSTAMQDVHVLLLMAVVVATVVSMLLISLLFLYLERRDECTEDLEGQEAGLKRFFLVGDFCLG